MSFAAVGYSTLAQGIVKPGGRRVNITSHSNVPSNWPDLASASWNKGMVKRLTQQAISDGAHRPAGDFSKRCFTYAHVGRCRAAFDVSNGQHAHGFCYALKADGEQVVEA